MLVTLIQIWHNANHANDTDDDTDDIIQIWHNANHANDTDDDTDDDE
jgi:hypothetical protein